MDGARASDWSLRVRREKLSKNQKAFRVSETLFGFRFQFSFNIVSLSSSSSSSCFSLSLFPFPYILFLNILFLVFSF